MERRVLLVTGALGVLGRAMMAAAAAAGWRAIGIDFAAAGGREDVFGGVDLTDADAAAHAVAAARALGGRIDALANIAGGFAWETVADGATATWRQQWEINVATALNASRAALPHLPAPGGAIVNVGAATALKAGAGVGAYTAAKAGVLRLTEALADEHKARGVRVNAVLPSILDTPANRASMPGADFAAWVAPADLAAVMLFLLSGEARAVTGALVPVTGRV